MKKNVLTQDCKSFLLKVFSITLVFTLFYSLFLTKTLLAWEVDVRDKSSMPQGLVVVDKTQKRLQYFEKHSPLILRHEYPSIHGEREGDKIMEGDLKTPEGVYFVTTKIKMDLDFQEYGSQAYAINYPNPIDRLRGKTGGGIWIHSKGSPIKNQTTQGCVAVDLDDIEELGQLLVPGTPILIAQTVTQNGIVQDGAMSENSQDAHLEQSEQNLQNENISENSENIVTDTVEQQYLVSENTTHRNTLTQDLQSHSQNELHNTDLTIQNEDKNQSIYNEQGREELIQNEILAQEDIFTQIDSDVVVQEGMVQETKAQHEEDQSVLSSVAQNTSQLEENEEERVTSSTRRHEKIPTEAEKAMQAQIEAQIEADIRAQHAENQVQSDMSAQSTLDLNIDQAPHSHVSDAHNANSTNSINTANTTHTINNDEQTLLRLTQEWNNAWADRSYEFFNFYEKDIYAKAQGQPFSAFYEQKDYLFRNMSWLFISYQDINVLEGPGYWVTWFPQYYRAPNHKTEGIRRLYWQKNANNEYKIVAMEWLPRNLDLDKEFTKHAQNTVPHFIEAWRLAWADADVRSYEGFYAIDAQQDALKGVASIIDKKKSIWAIKKPSEIVLSNIQIDDKSNAIHVYMNQAYTDTSGYKDYGVKRLVLHPRGSSWVIAQESWSRR